MLSQLRFKKFKSFIDANMPVEPITIMIGASGRLEQGFDKRMIKI